MNISKRLGFTVTLLVAACAQPPSPAGSGGTPPTSSADRQRDWADIQRVELQAKGIVRTDGCAHAGQCRTAPVGSRACGGPRYYLTYCAASTDTARLSRLLDRVKEMEEAYNRKWEIVSTCEYRTAPAFRFSSGFCEEIGSSR